MRNKVMKTNKTKFDYIVRRVGIASLFLMVLSLAVFLPLTSNLTKMNNEVTAQIERLQESGQEEIVIVEAK